MIRLTLILAVLAAATPAHANSACGNNQGIAPRSNTTLPPHPTVVAYDDDDDHPASDYTAVIDNKSVKINVTTRYVAPYHLAVIEVKSDKTGELRISRRTETIGYYKIGSPKLPANTTEIAGSPRRFTTRLRHSTVREVFDGLAIDLPADLPAILATIKIRRDDKAAWQQFDIPIYAPDRGKQSAIRIGELGCTSNYTVGLLEQGVDLEATVTLADGSVHPVRLPAKRTTLPKLPAKDPDDE